MAFGHDFFLNAVDFYLLIATVIAAALVGIGSMLYPELNNNRITVRVLFASACLLLWTCGPVWSVFAESQSMITRYSMAGAVGCVSAVACVWLFGVTGEAKIRDWPAANAQVAQSVTSYNQSGGVTAGTVNVAPQRLQFTPELESEIAARINDKSKTVFLRSVGGGKDQLVADMIENFLKTNGFQVDRRSIGTLSPPPDEKLSLQVAPDHYVFTVAPSAN